MHKRLQKVSSFLAVTVAAELLVAPGHVISTGANQVQAQSFNEMLTDFSGGGHSSAALAGLFFKGANRAEHTWQSVLTDQQHLLSV